MFMSQRAAIPLTPLMAMTLVVTSGCSSKPDLVLVRPASKPYHATYIGARDKAPGTVYDQAGRAMRLVYSQSPAGARKPSSAYQTVTTRSVSPRMSTADLLEGVRVKRDYISTRLRSRTGKSMKPRYITIHSTQNFSKGADAYRHALALKRGKLGKLCWHYTADENVTIQHLPTNEQGQHADFDGPGNRYSIGIEMCEHPGNSRSATLERTAKLTAWLMHQHKIPLSRVVPHYHWPRHGMSPAHKNCPHFLLDNGRPGRKWRGFQAKVKKYHDAITLPRSNEWASR
jgi:N-acetylmuramoyl-L-alanine amidase